MTDLKRRIYSVSEFSGALSLEIANRFPSVCVRGEVTNLSRPRSGHWYFALKDEQNQLRMVMFRSSNLRAPQIKDGDEIIACGKPTIYRERGDLQLVVSHIQSAGEGELQRRFELLKQELQQAGYFEPDRKQAIPRYPRKVAIITSASGAVIHDIQTVTSRRAPALPLLLLPSEVQGEKAIPSLCSALVKADGYRDVDLIILARGGGSLEDFAAFNSREVAEAIRACKTPVISSVGHESDISIADLVTDRRAATPSEAAEIASAGFFTLPDLLQQAEIQLQKNWGHQHKTRQATLALVSSRLRNPKERVQAAVQKLDSLEPLLTARLAARLEREAHRVDKATNRLDTKPLLRKIQDQKSYLAQIQHRLQRGQTNHWRQAMDRFQGSIKLLESVNPLGILMRGYSIALHTSGQVISSTDKIRAGETMVTRLKDGVVQSNVTEVKKQDLEGPD